MIEPGDVVEESKQKRVGVVIRILKKGHPFYPLESWFEDWSTWAGLKGKDIAEIGLLDGRTEILAPVSHCKKLRRATNEDKMKLHWNCRCKLPYPSIMAKWKEIY